MNWFYNLKLSTKLLSGFILVALIAGTVGLVGALKIKQLDGADKALYEEETQPLGHLADIASDFQRIRVNILYSLLYAGNAEKVKEKQSRIAMFRKQIAEDLALYEKGDRNAEDKELTAELKAGLASYDQFAKKLLDLAEAGKQQEALKFIETDGASVVDQMRKVVKHVLETKQKGAKATSDDNTVLANGAVRTLIILAVVAVLLAIGLGIFISRIIMRQLGADPKEVGEVANLVAAGDLSREIALKSGDSGSVMAAMKQMVESVNALVSDAAMLSKAAMEGKLSIRADATKHQGDFRTIVDGVNATIGRLVGLLDAMPSPAMIIDKD